MFGFVTPSVHSCAPSVALFTPRPDSQSYSQDRGCIASCGCMSVCHGGVFVSEAQQQSGAIKDSIKHMTVHIYIYRERMYVHEELEVI